jgi:phospholipase C
MTRAFRGGAAIFAWVCAAQVSGADADLAAARDAPRVTAQPDPTPAVAPYVIDPAKDAPLTNDEMAALARKKIKYVFVIFNENHSFDNEYGTFPGVDGLYSDGLAPRSAADTPGFTQSYKDINGTVVSVQPFLIGPSQNASFVDSVDHSHEGLAAKLHVVDGVPRMDGFSADEYRKYARAGNNMSQAEGTQFARLVMAHIDCDTIPLFWNFASRFTIFDKIFATEDTPSTPNAIAMIAGQAGESQWVGHASDAHPPLPMRGVIEGQAYLGSGQPQRAPIVNDPNPFWGSQYDATIGDRQPTSPVENYAPGNIAENLTFATVPLTAMGGGITETAKRDFSPLTDLADIQRDIAFIQGLNRPAVTWGWYQNGYDLEPTDTNAYPSHSGYVAHHNGAQYFGYIANNPEERRMLRGEGDFFADVANHALPKDGGAADPEPALPQPGGSGDGRTRGHRGRQIRRRRSSRLQRPSDQRGDERRGRQRDRRRSGFVGPERDRHNLRRVRWFLRSRAAAHPLLWSG